MAERSQLIAVLGDSRVFDTYFVNAKYGDNRYGADKTFPFLLRRALLGDDGSPFDLVHIADHFRSGTIANNIIRLALSDPAVVVLLDGIWETLVNKELFVDYANRAIRGHRTRSGKTLDLSYSSKRLAELFVAGELAISPARYAERQARIISYFRRRRRQCVWLTLPVPPPEHLDRVHYAGDYRCIPEWGECLSAINRSIVPMVERWGGMVLDLDAVIRENGGYGENLIDQWHFSAGFHARIAERLGALIDERGAEFAVPADHASHAVMLGGDPGAEPVVLVGKPAMEKRWAADNPNAAIEARLEHGPLDGHAARIVVVVGDPSTREALACDLLGALPADKVLVYAEELGDIDNPVTDDHKARQVDIET